MLKQRILTALVLLAVLLPALFYPGPTPFYLVSLVLIGAAGWEWARLQACRGPAAVFMGVALVALLAGLWWAGVVGRHWPLLWLAVGGIWVVLAVLMLRRGVTGWQAWPVGLRLWLGWLLLACAWLALVQARQLGLAFLLSALTLVWVADIAAYASGRAFGRRKLAPSLSPGKSWEGVAGGVLGVLLLGAGWLWFDGTGWGDQPSLFSYLWQWGAGLAVLVLLGLTAMSVVGDLLESLVKRAAGVKDSSQLLPGHGGVLDRVDALLPVLPLAMACATL